MHGLETWKLGDYWVILSQSKSKTHKTLDSDIHISKYTQNTHENKNIHNWNKELKSKQRIDESKEDKQRYLEVGRKGIKGKQTQTMCIQIIKGR